MTTERRSAVFMPEPNSTTKDLAISPPQFLFKTTNELTEIEKKGLSQLFEEVFHKPFPYSLFDTKYAHSCLGYSFHVVMTIDDAIVGAFSAIPVRYEFFGEQRLFATTADLMIAQGFRGRLSYVKLLSELLHERLTAAGISFILCCIRQEIWTVHEVVSKWKCIGRVSYYIAPLRVRYVPGLAYALRIGIRAWNLVSDWKRCNRQCQWPIQKINDDAFRKYRYRMFPAIYHEVPLHDGGLCVYTTEPFYPIEGLERIALALLVDVDPPARQNLEHAVSIVRRRDPKAEFVAYQGFLPCPPRNMLRVPKRFEKKSWVFAGRILRPELVDDRVFDIRQWKINLSNGDLV